ncbi:MAG: hypothetical protein NW208_11820 [Bryobacter sp.]|nr:hypothetical protein [Bryobacter sp.]
MTDNTLLTVLIVFVALCALSQLGQFLALMGVYRKLRDFQEKSAPLLAKAEGTLDAAKLTLEDSRRQMNEITAKTSAILDATQVQITKIDGVVTEASARAMSQMERLDLALGDTVERVHGLVAATHDGLLKPLKEVNGLVAGLRTGLGYFFGRKKSSVLDATQDEEMFI